MNTASQTLAKETADRLGLPFVVRGNSSVEALMEQYEVPAVMVAKKQALTLVTSGGELFFHSSMAHLRIKNLRMVDTGATCGDTLTTQQAAINDKTNDITAQNIYRIPTANGCGLADDAPIIAGAPLMLWSAAGNKRVNAFNLNDVVDGETLAADDKLVAFGVGPDSSLFRPDIIGALSNVPVYRHVQPDEYNRFVVLFKVSGVGINGQATFQAIVDGAGDTKDEELGELDNVRAT